MNTPAHWTNPLFNRQTPTARNRDLQFLTPIGQNHLLIELAIDAYGSRTNVYSLSYLYALAIQHLTKWYTEDPPTPAEVHRTRTLLGHATPMVPPSTDNPSDTQDTALQSLLVRALILIVDSPWLEARQTTVEEGLDYYYLVKWWAANDNPQHLLRNTRNHRRHRQSLRDLRPDPTTSQGTLPPNLEDDRHHRSRQEHPEHPQHRSPTYPRRRPRRSGLRQHNHPRPTPQPTEGSHPSGLDRSLPNRRIPTGSDHMTSDANWSFPINRHNDLGSLGLHLLILYGADRLRAIPDYYRSKRTEHIANLLLYTLEGNYVYALPGLHNEITSDPHVANYGDDLSLSFLINGGISHLLQATIQLAREQVSDRPIGYSRTTSALIHATHGTQTLLEATIKRSNPPHMDWDRAHRQFLHVRGPLHTEFDPSWRTSDTVNLAREITQTRNTELLPILADAVQEAGLAEETLLNQLRQEHQESTSVHWIVRRLMDQQ